MRRAVGVASILALTGCSGTERDPDVPTDFFIRASELEVLPRDEWIGTFDCSGVGLVDLEREPATKRLDRLFGYEFTDLPLTVMCSAPGAGSVVIHIGTTFDGLTEGHEVAAGAELEVLDFRFENNTDDRVGFLIVNRDEQ